MSLEEMARQIIGAGGQPKARRSRFTMFESSTFVSEADVVGEDGDDSIEGQVERWRREEAAEKDFLGWSHEVDGGMHFFTIRWVE